MVPYTAMNICSPDVSRKIPTEFFKYPGHCVNTLSLVLPGIGIRDPEFAVNCNNEPVEREHNIAGIFPVHGARLVPDHFLAQKGCELLDLRSPELLRQHEPLHVIPGTRTRPVPVAARNVLQSA